MAELLGDAGEIADAVAVAVIEAARVDLVDHRAAPPFVSSHRTFSSRLRVIAGDTRIQWQNHENAMIEPRFCGIVRIPQRPSMDCFTEAEDFVAVWRFSVRNRSDI
jgi:hypothetical protein